MNVRGFALSLEVVDEFVAGLVEAILVIRLLEHAINPVIDSSPRLKEGDSALQSRIPSLWTNSYFVATTGGAPLAVVESYIENQKNV